MTSSGPGLVSVSVQFLYLVTKLNRTEPFNGKQKPNQTEPNHVWKIKTKPNRTVYELSSHLNQTIIFSFHHLCFFPSLLPSFLSFSMADHHHQTASRDSDFLRDCVEFLLHRHKQELEAIFFAAEDTSNYSITIE